MNTQTIDGRCYARMLMGGAAQLAAHAEELNALNVFPVADGDTGTNMFKTIEGGLSGVQEDAESIGELSRRFARGILLSARGNSGVILSQIFAGINEKLEGHDAVSAEELAEAYRNGIARSYAAVQNPTEGTILTVFRESTEYAATHIGDDSSVEDFFRFHIDEARRSLASTKERLAVLAEADVVDSGAAGYLCIAEGMYEILSGKEPEQFQLPTRQEAVDIDRFTRDSVLEFGYCTEFLLRLTTAKVDPDSFEVRTVLDALEALGGESVVAYKQEDIIKVHVHTFTPGVILAKMQDYGEFLTVKVENMSLGHSEKEAPRRKVSVVAVAAGEGLAALFRQMGADEIISGGQTANPSIGEFIEAFRRCGAENIIVLPNNKNILLAAKQAAELFEDAQVRVIETVNLMQGFSALSVITPELSDVEMLISSATHAAEGVLDGEITRAVRDADVEGFCIREGDYMAISDGHICAVAGSSREAVLKLLESMDTDLAEVITVFSGNRVSVEERADLIEEIKAIYEDCEVIAYEGGQDVYDYFIAVE